jgi:hypothetical protein
VLYGHVNTLLQLCGTNSCLHFFKTLFVDSSCENGSSCSAISCFVIGPIRNALQKTGADVGRLVRKLDRLGNSDSILCYFGLAKGLVDEYVASELVLNYPPGPSVTATASDRLTHPSSIFLRAAAPKSSCFEAKYRMGWQSAGNRCVNCEGIIINIQQ